MKKINCLQQYKIDIVMLLLLVVKLLKAFMDFYNLKRGIKGILKLLKDM